MLHFSTTGLAKTFRTIQEQMGENVHFANMAVFQEEIPLDPAYINALKKDFRAELREYDFVRNTPQAIREINAWISEQTRGKIEDLLQQGDLNPATRLVLLSVLYLKVDWRLPFPKEKTQEGPFFISPEQEITLPMMSQEGLFALTDQGDFRAIELPYKEEGLALWVLLPKKKRRLKPDDQRAQTRRHFYLEV